MQNAGWSEVFIFNFGNGFTINCFQIVLKTFVFKQRLIIWLTRGLHHIHFLTGEPFWRYRWFRATHLFACFLYQVNCELSFVTSPFTDITTGITFTSFSLFKTFSSTDRSWYSLCFRQANRLNCHPTGLQYLLQELPFAGGW